MEKIMSVTTLSTQVIESSKPKKKAYHKWCNITKGFGVCFHPSGRKTFVMQAMRDDTRYYETLGEYPILSLKEARILAKARIKEITNFHNINEHSPFRLMAELTFMRNERLWKPKTMKVNRDYLRASINPYIGDLAIGGITKKDIKEWYAKLKNTPASANRSVPIISKIMNEAEEMALRPVGSNPVSGLKRYPKPKKQRVLTDDEMADFGLAIKRRRKEFPYQTGMLLLIILTGCRSGEMKDLEWRDYRGGNLYLRDSKTGPKTIFLCSYARKILDELPRTKSKLVFPSTTKRGKHVTLNRIWPEIRKEVGIEDVRLHDLRHSYASFAIRSGENITVIGLLLGHNQTETTLRYTKLADQQMRDAANKINESQTKTKEDFTRFTETKDDNEGDQDDEA
jgi:integrase